MKGAKFRSGWVVDECFVDEKCPKGIPWLLKTYWKTIVIFFPITSYGKSLSLLECTYATYFQQQILTLVTITQKFWLQKAQNFANS